MADPVSNSNLPFAGEMALAGYLSNLFGSGKTPNPNYTGATVPAPQLVGQVGGQDMQNLMTEFLRGNGQFLQNMMQQNQSGLYNSSTRKLLANDLTAQAALKATQANLPIQQGNASLMNQYYSRLANQQPQYLPGDPNKKQNAAMALGIAALQKLMEGGGKDGKGKTGKGESSVKNIPGNVKDVGSGIMEALSSLMSGGESFPDLPAGGFEAMSEANPFGPVDDNMYNSISDLGQQAFTGMETPFLQDNSIGGGGLGDFYPSSFGGVNGGAGFQTGGDFASAFANPSEMSSPFDYSSFEDQFDTPDYSSVPTSGYDFFAGDTGGSYDFSDWGF